MFSTNNNANTSPMMKVSSDGISRGIKLKQFEFKDEKNRLDVLLVDPEGKTLTLYFRCPDTDWSLKRQTYTLGSYEDFFSALVPKKENGSSKFGETQSFDSFKEWCNHFTSKIDINTAPAFDIVLLYAKDKAVKEDDKISYPMIVTGSRPYISSPYEKANLNPDIDLKSSYPKYLSYEIVEIESIDSLNTSFPKTSAMQNPFNEDSPSLFATDDDPFGNN